EIVERGPERREERRARCGLVRTGEHLSVVREERLLRVRRRQEADDGPNPESELHGLGHFIPPGVAPSQGPSVSPCRSAAFISCGKPTVVVCASWHISTVGISSAQGT